MDRVSATAPVFDRRVPRASALRRATRGVARGLVLVVATVSLLFGAGLQAFVGRLARVEPTDAAAAGIVVLTGGADRIADGARLLESGAGRRLLISGVNARTTPADMAKKDQRLAGLIHCCVDFGYEALDTIGNAHEARRWSAERGYSSLVVVTSAWHMPRTLVEFGAAMPDVRLVPFPVVTDTIDVDRWWSDPATARLLAMEYVKYLMASVRVRVGREVPRVSEVAAGDAPHAFRR